MNRAELEHIIRTAAAIAQDDEIVIVGNPAVLARFPDVPTALVLSVGADLYPRNRPERAELIDGTIGEGSPFHAAHGYYARGVDETTAVLPRGWVERIVRVETRGAIGLCLEVHDLVISKLVTGGENDLHFARAVANRALLVETMLRARLARTELEDSLRQTVDVRITDSFAAYERHSPWLSSR